MYNQHSTLFLTVFTVIPFTDQTVPGSFTVNIITTVAINDTIPIWQQTAKCVIFVIERKKLSGRGSNRCQDNTTGLVIQLRTTRQNHIN